MKETSTRPNIRGLGISALGGLTLSLQVNLAIAQMQTSASATHKMVGRGQIQSISLEKPALTSYDEYILGPGDGLQVQILNFPELSGTYSIGPNGTIYLPRLQALYGEGLTVEELRLLVSQEFKTYLRSPEVFVRPVIFRPIRVYVGGEVKRPGYYAITGTVDLTRITSPSDSSSSTNRVGIYGAFPTVFDAIRTAQGITPYSNLSEVEVTRKRAKGLGGGHIRTSLNFISLIKDGNESQNIRIYDGDVLRIGKSKVALRKQLLKAGQSNLNPQFMEIFVTGRIKTPGSVRLPQGATLTQAISIAGGAKPIRGKIEFVRFTSEGDIERKIFAYRPNAEAGTTNNPILTSGDLIRIQDSILSVSTDILNELTSPLISIYTVYSLFD